MKFAFIEANCPAFPVRTISRVLWTRHRAKVLDLPLVPLPTPVEDQILIDGLLKFGL